MSDESSRPDDEKRWDGPRLEDPNDRGHYLIRTITQGVRSLINATAITDAKLAKSISSKIDPYLRELINKYPSFPAALRRVIYDEIVELIRYSEEYIIFSRKKESGDIDIPIFETQKHLLYSEKIFRYYNEVLPDLNQFDPDFRNGKFYSLSDYRASNEKLSRIFSKLRTFDAIRTFPSQTIYAIIITFGFYAGPYIQLISHAFAADAAYKPPLGLSQELYNEIVFAFVGLVILLVLGLFYVGYIAKPKSQSAANAVSHLVTFLTGALIGNRGG